MNATWEELYASADRPGQGPIFVPHLSGERTPYSDPALRGSWSALSLADDRTSLLRSALEGTAFAIRDALDALLEVRGLKIRGLKIRGLKIRGSKISARRVSGWPAEAPWPPAGGSCRGRAWVAAVCRRRARGVRPRRGPLGSPRGRPAQF